MNMFKLYMKIAKSQWKTLLTYLGVFCSIFVVWGLIGNESSPIAYSMEKPSIALIDQDHSELSASITSYLHEKATIKDVGNTASDLKDALYFGDVTYVLEIPKGFEQSFVKGEAVELLAQTKPDDVNAVLLNQSLNSYLKNIDAYQKIMPTASISSLHKNVSDDMKQEVTVSMAQKGKINSNRILRSSFFNYMSYILMALTIMIIGLTMTSIHKSEIKMRNLVSPIKSSSMSMQLVLANVSFGIGFLLCFILIIFAICNKEMMNISGAIYVANAFVFMLVCVTMAYMFSMMVSGIRNAENALNGISNIVALGSSFLCGAFVPQMFLSDSVLHIASFLPTYWYIRLADSLQTVTMITQEHWLEIGKCLGIQLLFALAFLTIALAITKHKRSVQQIADTTK